MGDGTITCTIDNRNTHHNLIMVSSAESIGSSQAWLRCVPTKVTLLEQTILDAAVGCSTSTDPRQFELEPFLFRQVFVNRLNMNDVEVCFQLHEIRPISKWALRALR